MNELYQHQQTKIIQSYKDWIEEFDDEDELEAMHRHLPSLVFDDYLYLGLLKRVEK